MLHSLHFETPCLTKICGCTCECGAEAPDTVDGLPLPMCAFVGNGGVCFDARSELLLAVIFSANSRLFRSIRCCDECAFSTESAKRAVNSLASNGRSMAVAEFC